MPHREDLEAQWQRRLVGAHLSGFAVEIFRSSDNRDPGTWLAETNGIPCAVFGRNRATIFPTAKAAWSAANSFRLKQPSEVAHFVVQVR